MNRFLLLSAFFFITFSAFAQSNKKWVALFNQKDFSGWNRYLSVELDTSGKRVSQADLGLNNDPQGIFSVVKEKGEKVIRISGQTWGAISTINEYSNYHLQLKFKWGVYTWAGKRNKPKDSGLLYHSIGDYKNNYSGWLRSQEFQIEEGNCGDYWSIGKVRQHIHSTKIEKNFVYDPSGELRLFGDSGVNWCHRREVVKENPAGEWNTLDLFCYGDTSIHVVNGKVVMVLFESQMINQGQALSLTKGKIQLQSEGAEVFYKDIRIRNIDALPAVKDTSILTAL